jgi:hypothetical protein
VAAWHIQATRFQNSWHSVSFVPQEFLATSRNFLILGHRKHFVLEKLVLYSLKI